MGDLRCITIRQPYPSLIAHQVKRFETRSWKTSYRGPLAIHAAANLRDFWRIWQTGHQQAYGTEAAIVAALDPDVWDSFSPPAGAVVAVAELVDCIPIVPIDKFHDLPLVEVGPDGLTWWQARDYWHHESDEVDISDQLPLGHWEPGNWAWQLSDIRRLAEPIPAKGRERLWRPDGDLAAAITEATP